jgi:hypothetical protein
LMASLWSFHCASCNSSCWISTYWSSCGFSLLG